MSAGKSYTYWRFVVSGLLGAHLGGYRDLEINKKVPNISAISTIVDENDLAAIIDEGRRQIDSQVQRVEYASTRAQILLALGVAVIGFIVTRFETVDDLDEPWESIARTLMAGGGAVVAYGTMGAAAVLVTRVTFTRPDTTDLANRGTGFQKRLADDYVGSVILGENTAAARVTHLRIAVNLFVLGLIVSMSGVLIQLWE